MLILSMPDRRDATLLAHGRPGLEKKLFLTLITTFSVQLR